MKSENEAIKKESMAVDENTGEIVWGSEEDVQEIVENWKSDYDNIRELKKIRMRKYNEILLNFWRHKLNDDLTYILDILRENRSVTCLTYSQFSQVTEFLYLHETDFMVTKINADKDICIISLF